MLIPINRSHTLISVTFLAVLVPTLTTVMQALIAMHAVLLPILSATTPQTRDPMNIPKKTVADREAVVEEERFQMWERTRERKDLR